jgi:sec-independent protein translocase protein TatA
MVIYPLGVIGPWQVVIIALVVLLLFGGRKIPELMEGLGKGMKSFKKGLNEIEKETRDIEKDLKLMDLTAATLCKDNNIKIHVYALAEGGNIKRAVRGEKIGTLIS